VVHSLLRNQPELVTTIECTLPIATIIYAPTVLTSSGYTVIDEGSPDFTEQNTRRLYTLKGLCSLDTAPFFKSRDEAEPHPIHFDWNMITLSRDRLSIRRPFPKSLKYTGDVMTAVIARIINSKFCIMPLTVELHDEDEDAADTTHNSKVAKLDANAMRKATCLVENGWKMDDWLDGSNGWVVSRWIDLLGTRNFTQPPSLKTHSSCPLCYERFAEDDIVVNLPCNHNFHVNCHPNRCTPPDVLPSTSSRGNQSATSQTTTSGLCAWLSNGHVTCPCCRAHIRLREKPKC
jgi:hypothetical protein